MDVSSRAKDVRADYQRAYRQSPEGRAARARERTKARAKRRTTFVGVDGEGGGNPHRYKLLRAGEHVLFRNNRPLTSYECLEFLADLPRSVTYVAYFFDYDVTMILSGLPPERLQRVCANIKTGFNTEWRGFEICYRPGKYFKVRRVGMKSYVSINDVGSFFQCRFTQALTDWGIGDAEDWALIEAGKDSRAVFDDMTDKEIEYNALEVELLERLMSKFAAVCRGLSLTPRQWQGPGEIAQVLLSKHDVPRTSQIAELLPTELLKAANDSYFGGRFEVTTFGRIEGPIHNYDIRSAYPDGMRRLPCLLHGEWTCSKKPLPDADLYLAKIAFMPKDDGKRHQLMGLPVRAKDGRISWPLMGMGWYWSVEIEAAKHQQVEYYVRTWSYKRQCSCKPFDFVEPLYNERMALKSQPDGANKGLALKLALNSLYGKSAQSIGKPTYANPVYASLLTAITRAKLYGMVHEISRCDSGMPCGRNVYYLATDGILSGDAAPSEDMVGSELGMWEHSMSDDDILLIASGLYIGAGKAKTRGIPKTLMQAHTADFERICDVWEHPEGKRAEDMLVEILCRQFFGLVQANHLEDWKRLGQWIDVPRKYTISWDSKRSNNSWRYSRGFAFGPKLGDVLEESVPYGKHIGAIYYDKSILDQYQPDTSDLARLGQSDDMKWKPAYA